MRSTGFGCDRCRRYLYRRGGGGERRPPADRQGVEHACRSVPGCDPRAGQAARGQCELAARADHPLHPRHHGGHQCRDRAEGCGHRPAHHRRLRGCADGRPPEALPALQPVHRAGDPGLPRSAPAPLRYSRAHRQPAARSWCPSTSRPSGMRCSALVEQHRVQAIAVVYLFSFLAPAHERRTKQIIETEFPDIAVSNSCEIDPTFREYERTLVTTFDAYLRPKVASYVDAPGAGAGGFRHRRRRSRSCNRAAASPRRARRWPDRSACCAQAPPPA